MENNLSPQFGGEPGTPVPVVDVDDVKAIVQMLRELEREHPGKQWGIGIRVMERVCKPGADVRAVSYRLMQLGLLKMISEQKVDNPEVAAQFTQLQSKIAPLMQEGEFKDAALREIARIPMEWMATGVPREDLHYDFDEFLKLCAA